LKYSVVLPVHDKCPFLAATLASLQSNAANEQEFVIVFDRARSEAQCIALAFLGGVQNYVVMSSLKPGLPSVLNLGVLGSHGKYIARIDADDMVLPNRFERQAAFLDAKSGVVAVGTQVRFIDEHGGVQGDSRYPLFSWQIHKELELWNPLAHPSMMYRRETFVLAGGYDERIEFAQDFELARRLRVYGRIRNLAEPGILYRRHPQQISETKSSERNEVVSKIIRTRLGRVISRKNAETIVALYESKNTKFGTLRALGLFSMHRPIAGLQICFSVLYTRIHFALLKILKLLRWG
jgi:glycosyltransferase involved in cell wall biosynthesis